jgi:translocation and assembly module TamA
MKKSRSPFRRQHCAMPEAWRALLLAGVALLHGCAATRGEKKDAAATGAGADGNAGASVTPAPVSFKVDVVSDNHRVARHLERYLDIQRFADFEDLQAGELRRLLGETESNARDLLAAIGYFQPQLDLEAGETPGKPDAKRRIVIKVDPGEQTKIGSRDILFAEPMNSDAQGEPQRRAIRRDWQLKQEDPFTQEGWDAAKTEGLRTLQRERYPTARIAESEAVVNADTSRAALLVNYDPGPAYRFGPLKLEGLQRYDTGGVRNIASIPTGQVYSEAALLDAQQRLVGSGYFDSVFLMLDNNEQDPDAATVVAQLREAKLQKIVFGVGYSTDTGPRVSVDHTHNKMWPLGWRALNQVAAGTHTQSLATNWTAMPKASGWAWNTGLTLERADTGDIKTNSLSLTGGRARNADRTERRYYLQYDASNAEGGDAPTSSSSLLGNYAWTGRYFNDRFNPVQGFGVGLDAGVGLTVTPERKPFLRSNLRALQLWPFGGRNAAGKRSRLAVRAEVGGILAGDDVDIPARLLFLTGGDTTVRGYKYQSIGTRLDDGSIYGARYMAMGGVEWQHPITVSGDARSFEHTIFVDAGAAADQPHDMVIFPGVGTGVRWNGPVGPLQVDVAYGTRSHNWRLHLRVGFQFQ